MVATLEEELGEVDVEDVLGEVDDDDVLLVLGLVLEMDESEIDVLLELGLVEDVVELGLVLDDVELVLGDVVELVVSVWEVVSVRGAVELIELELLLGAVDACD